MVIISCIKYRTSCLCLQCCLFELAFVVGAPELEFYFILFCFVILWVFDFLGSLHFYVFLNLLVVVQWL